MNYQEAVNWLFSRLPAYHRIGKAAYKGSLNNTLELDNYFNHPHRSYMTIHVAGTNGKGSVSHMLASALQEAGYKTGLYTSPHLRDFRERIRVNGLMIPEDEVISFIADHRTTIDMIEPSFFEMTAAMAFDYFARMRTEVAVIETGMGGRLDSTNIITPVLSVITNIGHDHMEFLGPTLEAVAAEKAGIIKETVPVVIGETHPETENVFMQRAESVKAPITFADRRYKCDLGSFDEKNGLRAWVLNDNTLGTTISGITPLGGLSQEKNIQTVAAAFDVLSGIPCLNLNMKHLIKGIGAVVSNTGLLGRWQVLANDPLTVCDTGHNREGLEYVLRQIRQTMRKRVHMIIGFVNDKDLSSVLPLFPSDAVYYFTRASIPRALDEKILRETASAYNLAGESYPSVNHALAAARKNADAGDMIFIGGSTFVVAEVV